LGETLQLRLSGAETFDVSPTTGLNLGSLAWNNVWANPTETTTYTITGTNSDGQTDTHEITIEVVKAGFEAFDNAIQIHQDANNNLVYINGQLQMVDITVLDANDNVIMNVPTQDNTMIIGSDGFTDGLHYLNIQHKDYPNVRTKTILKQ